MVFIVTGPAAIALLASFTATGFMLTTASVTAASLFF
jgi:hypothetical protein